MCWKMWRKREGTVCRADFCFVLLLLLLLLLWRSMFISLLFVVFYQKIFFSFSPVLPSLPPFSKSADDVQLIVECLRCLRAVMNNQFGLAGVLRNDRALKAMCLCLDFPDAMPLPYKLTLLNSLTVLCGATHNGHR